MSIKSHNKGNKGHSTRYKFKSLPKYVYFFLTKDSKKVYRVCKKVQGKTVTKGYFKDLKDAKLAAREL